MSARRPRHALIKHTRYPLPDEWIAEFKSGMVVKCEVVLQVGEKLDKSNGPEWSCHILEVTRVYE